MATTKQQPMTREGQGGGNRLIFPNHLAELINQDIGHPFLMLLNNEDSSEICLPIPDAISLADGANYEGLDKTDFKSAEKFAEGAKLTPADQLALGLRVTKTFPGLEKVSQDQFLRNRMAVNPMTEMAFTGMNMRSISLSFELLPRNEKEAQTIRDIESRLREMMYPEKTGEVGYSVRYPALFTLKFMAGEHESRFFPILHDAYLKDMSTDFRAQAGAYLKVDNDFMGQKHKIDLSFSEAKMMTRKEIQMLDSHEPDRGELAVNKPITTKAEDVISANKPKPKG